MSRRRRRVHNQHTPNRHWTWQTLGCPKKVQLIELGPGRGTMMADMLRASARFRPFLDALSVHMVDTSEQLQEIQVGIWADRQRVCVNAMSITYQGALLPPSRALLLR